ncbi:LuxR C-terminal-related transcriptional regulator [uncultured Phascolarctobacterium sp.]|uniref:response regulator transcription factor n=1 Tax=uncultured Phascolarctobacterium sp. TaxID=512296 RepID=UPI002607535F|nr:LuxR C-terminal-related transcriptional regulator [uncultured Phascolarctobacterium sp.]
MDDIQKTTTAELGKILTQRELQILKLVCQDLTYQEIAESLNISKRTISFHISNMLHKTGQRSIVGLAVAAVQQGIADLSKENAIISKH